MGGIPFMRVLRYVNPVRNEFIEHSHRVLSSNTQAELTTMKKNCWEYKQCGRQPGGSKVGELGVCPAFRSCWVVAGTFCGGEKQGSFASKLGSCMSCDFYKAVKSEEGDGFQMSSVLLKKLG